MTYYTKVVFKQNLIIPQPHIVRDTLASVNDLTSCFLNPDDCISDNPKSFKNVKINNNINDVFWDELKELDKLLI